MNSSKKEKKRKKKQYKSNKVGKLTRALFDDGSSHAFGRHEVGLQFVLHVVQ